MTAKHRMPALPEQRRSAIPGARQTMSAVMSAVATICDAAFASILCTAFLMALVFNGVQHEKPTVEATQSAPPVSQPVSQEGTVVSVTAGSVTTRSASGYIQTYLFTPNTTVITNGGRQPVTAAAHFTVNDRVVIVGTIEGGTALATTVADRDQGLGYGPPMDSVQGQVIPAGRG